MSNQTKMTPEREKEIRAFILESPDDWAYDVSNKILQLITAYIAAEKEKYMPRHKLNDEAATRVLGWKLCRGRISEHVTVDQGGMGYDRRCDLCGRATHGSAPDMGEPANQLAMIEWLWERGSVTLGEEGCEFQCEPDGEVFGPFLGPLHDCVIEAVCSVPEEK